MVGPRSDQREGVEGIGLVGVAGFQADAGEQAGDRGAVGDFGVEGFDQRGSLGDLGGVARIEVGLGELCGEAGIAGRVCECGNEQGFGVSRMVLGEQNVGKRGGRLGIVGGDGEVAAIGVLGGGQVGGGFGDFGGEQDVFGLLGGQFQGGEEVGGGGAGVGARGVLRVAVEVETGEGAEGAGFECG